ncbi:VOC family protein [Streptomyces sp. NPDC007988]|uniref:VOC family protein n=1 Tax=Streptomyces sp. NPDC007988 TaxID=3364802 RepID=UPI0036E91610
MDGNTLVVRQEPAMAGEISFFELGVDDPRKARTFYGNLFGWTFEDAPGGTGFAITTPTVPGGVHGADAEAAPYVFFKVDDLASALERIVELGGTVEGPDADTEDGAGRFGRFRFCRDDQGSPFGIHEPPAR